MPEIPYEKMNIQWFPGHMTKAQRMIEENLKMVDAVCEILDARIPNASRNPDIDRLAAGKPRLVILNRTDLADPAVTARWRRHFESRGLAILETDAKSGRGVKEFAPAVRRLLAEKLREYEAKGQVGRALRVMILGIPNVGKSTFINKVAGRKAAIAGDRPGVTRGKQWIRLDTKIELLDTPGLLWPKFEDRTVGENLALIGSINDQILPQDELAMLLITRLRKSYPGVIGNRFGIDENAENVIPLAGQSEESARSLAILEAVGQKRGCLVRGGGIDYGRASAIMLDEFRSGNLGRITLESADI